MLVLAHVLCVLQIVEIIVSMLSVGIANVNKSLLILAMGYVMPKSIRHFLKLIKY